MTVSIPPVRSNSETSAEIVVAGIPQTATADIDHLIGNLSSITMPSKISCSINCRFNLILVRGICIVTDQHFKTCLRCKW